MKFSALPPFLLKGMTIRVPASSPEVSPLKQSVPGLSQPGSCSLSSTHAAASTSVSSTSNSLEGYMRTHGQPLPPLGLGSCDLQSKSHQVRSSFLSFCPIHVSFSSQSRTVVSASCRRRGMRSLLGIVARLKCVRSLRRRWRWCCGKSVHA